MADALESSSSEESLLMQWNISSRRSRKSGCSNIFTGLNMHQLHRLFRTAGERNAEHRAKLVWQGIDDDMPGANEEKDEEEGEDTRLAEALVGLKVRARNKAGIRVEGWKDHKWNRALGYLRIKEPLSDFSPDDEETTKAPSAGEFLLPTEEDISDRQNPFKPSSWRLGVTRLEGARDSERYLHRILC
ncbi:uncharacterized protein avpi1 [Oreochromis niloticus]|uniref:uncharacterized protein avpi1 n=1 Tax=Oreochromis niloticus TaxID=8128 RepID=UPI00022B3B6F|nr:uncharacterized protein LOC100704557 [Oreochromis niloticus]